jgi:type I restriction enzyme R subunit
MSFNENTRVKIPAILHLGKLGYEYLSLSAIKPDENTNIFNDLQQIYDKVTELNRKNNLLKAKYKNDVKYVRVHKRIIENGKVSKREMAISESLMVIKQQADDRVLNNSRLLNNVKGILRI